MPSGKRTTKAPGFQTPKGGLKRVLQLLCASFLAIHVWCNAVVAGFGWIQILQVIVVSLLLIVLQVGAVYHPLDDDEFVDE